MLLNHKTSSGSNYEGSNELGSFFKDIMIIRNEKFRYNKAEKLAQCQIKGCGRVISCSGIGWHLGSIHKIYGKKYVWDEIERKMKVKPDPKNTKNKLKKPYQCNKCNQGFTSKTNWEDHLANGSNEPKNCNHCGMKFCTTYSFNKHTRSVHSDIQITKGIYIRIALILQIEILSTFQSRSVV